MTYQADEIIRGGTGYGLDNKLPDEIERIYPDYSLYPPACLPAGHLPAGEAGNIPKPMDF
jgi:hypothetical protein